MTDSFNYSDSQLNGFITAENYIDECVLRVTQEKNILFRIVQKMSGDDEKSKAELRGFCDCIHMRLVLAC